MKTGSLLSSILILSVLLGPIAEAQESPRPRVGLVLGGGGARGAAHIGVLEVLENLRIPVDCVAGTSMGGLVSGAFAAGIQPSEMREALAKADWDDMFQDNPAYSEINYRNKAISKRFLPGSETGIKDDGLVYQAGVVSGQKIKLFFNKLVHSDVGERNIESLPLPLSIIATNIGNGEKVVLREGSLTKAMRASMSVPGLMSPVLHAGHKLVDGGLVDNVPIDEARNRCNADIVIVVNVGSPLLKPEDVGSLLSVSAQMINILTEQNVTRSLATLKPNDIYIKPDLNGITAGDFKLSAETADRGKTAAQALSDKLKALSVTEDAYIEWQNKIAYSQKNRPVVDEVQVADLKVVNPVALERHLRVKLGEPTDDISLDQDLMRAYGDGWYESVDYALLNIRDRNILRVTPVEKNWGPDYLRLGINFESNFKQDTHFTLRAAYDKTWLNTLGGQITFLGEIGKNNLIGLDYYQPLEATQRYFTETSLSYGKKNTGLYQDNKKLAEYEVIDGNASLGLGVNVGLLGQVRGGYQYNWIDSSLETGIPLTSFPAESKYSYGNIYLGFDFDQMDRLYLPTSGWSSQLLYTNAPGENYSKLKTELRAAYSIQDIVFNGRLAYQGSLSGNLPSYDPGSLGGFLNLSGFSRGQLMGDDVRYGSLRIEKIIGRLPMGLRGDMRMGASLETGRVGTPYTETNIDQWTNSAALYLGGETPLGPVFLGYGRNSTGASSVYLFLGTP